MSGPIDELAATGSPRGITAIEVREGRTTNIGSLGIIRVLPTKNRRTVGPWCFVDLLQADDVEHPPPLEIGPHPHIGLATVTWLFSGTVLHSDSLGTEQLIRPGQLNLMTAGHGIAHAEEGVDMDATWQSSGTMGVQMWLAQRDSTRHGASAFQHLSEVPETTQGPSQVKVLLGALGDAVSPADFAHPSIGLDVTLRGPTVIPSNPDYEHAVVPVAKPVTIENEVVDPGSLALIPPGLEELRLDARSTPARLMLLGGEPLGDRIEMWWNFVARGKEELARAWRDWAAGDEDRFGPVSSRLRRIDAPTPPWLRQGG